MQHGKPSYVVDARSTDNPRGMGRARWVAEGSYHRRSRAMPMECWQQRCNLQVRCGVDKWALFQRGSSSNRWFAPGPEWSSCRPAGRRSTTPNAWGALPRRLTDRSRDATRLDRVAPAARSAGAQLIARARGNEARGTSARSCSARGARLGSAALNRAASGDGPRRWRGSSHRALIFAIPSPRRSSTGR